MVTYTKKGALYFKNGEQLSFDTLKHSLRVGDILLSFTYNELDIISSILLARSLRLIITSEKKGDTANGAVIGRQV